MLFLRNLSLQNSGRFKFKPIVFKLKSLEIRCIGTSSEKTPTYKNFFKKLDTTFSRWGVNAFYASDGQLTGILTENNIPRQNVFVNLYQASTGVFVARVLTNQEGFFKFDQVAEDLTYFIVASDPKGIYNSVTIDGIRIDSRKDYTVDLG